MAYVWVIPDALQLPDFRDFVTSPNMSFICFSGLDYNGGPLGCDGLLVKDNV